MQHAASVLTDLLKRLPVDIDLDALARETKAIRRKRQVGDGAITLRPALADTGRGLGRLRLADLSEPGTQDRLDRGSTLVERLLAATTPGADLRRRGRTLCPPDRTSISQPGSKGTDRRVHRVFDLGRGGFSHRELTGRHGAEGLERDAPLTGGIRIGDRDYAHAPVP